MGGGHGHAVRGLAVLDRLSRRAPDLTTALVAPSRHAAWCAAKGVSLWSPADAVRDPEPPAAWAEALPRPRRLVADVFPRGVVGELAGVLPRLERKAWLVSRWVRPRAWLEPEIRTALEQRYERVLWCERPPDELRGVTVAQTDVGPVLVERPEDCLSPEEAREALGLGGTHTPVVILLGAGSEEEQRDALRLLLKVQVHLGEGAERPFELVALSARLPPTRVPGLLVRDAFPAMRVLRAARLLIASGGYASWHEARALGVPAVFLPQPRPWDDQLLRVAETRPPTTPEELEIEIARRLREPEPADRPDPIRDGTDEIAAALVDAC